MTSSPDPFVPPPSISGKRVIITFVVLMGLALFFGLAIWFSARTPWRAKPVGSEKTAMDRNEVAGQALVQVLHTCLSETSLREPVHIRLRVTLLSTGAVRLQSVDVNIADGTLAPCSRRAPSLVRSMLSEGDGKVPLEVRFDSELEPDGTRVTRSNWKVLHDSPLQSPRSGRPVVG